MGNCLTNDCLTYYNLYNHIVENVQIKEKIRINYIIFKF